MYLFNDDLFNVKSVHNYETRALSITDREGVCESVIHSLSAEVPLGEHDTMAPKVKSEKVGIVGRWATFAFTILPVYGIL